MWAEIKETNKAGCSVWTEKSMVFVNVLFFLTIHQNSWTAFSSYYNNKLLQQQCYQWRTSPSAIMRQNESPQRHNIRIMTVLSPYRTRREILIFCQRASQSREMCHACQRVVHTQGHDGRAWRREEGKKQQQESWVAEGGQSTAENTKGVS